MTCRKSSSKWQFRGGEFVYLSGGLCIVILTFVMIILVEQVLLQFSFFMELRSDGVEMLAFSAILVLLPTFILPIVLYDSNYPLEKADP